MGLYLDSMQELHSALQDHHPGSLQDRVVPLGGLVAQGLGGWIGGGGV
jgi:hypothetical protein